MKTVITISTLTILLFVIGCESSRANYNPQFWNALDESVDRMVENERYEREYQLRWYSADGPGALRPRQQRPVIIMPHNYEQEQYYWRKNREALNNPYHPPLPR